MTKNRPSQYSSSIYKIHTLITSVDFIARHRQAARDFTRRAVFTFERVVGVLLVNLMRSLQVELDQFFSRISLALGPSRS